MKNTIVVKLIALLLVYPVVIQGQYGMEKLNRGIVAVRSGSNNFISWRWLGNEEDAITFNLYRNGTKVNSSPLTVCNFQDNGAANNATYYVKAIVGGVEQASSETVNVWGAQYLKIPIQAPAGGTTPANETYTYNANDASVADLDGDGDYEIVIKWDPSNSKDNSQSGYTGNTYIDAYQMDGTRMWRIDFGVNIRSGAHYLDFMVYDFDQDGKAEMMVRTADGTKDAKGTVIGSANADYRSTAGYVLTGPEFFSVFNGQTGVVMATTDYWPARGTVSTWGDNYGNRVDRFRAAVAYLDGKKPSGIFCRGYYTRLTMAAWDWDGKNLSRRWTFDSGTSSSNAYYGQGDHSMSVADVDGDGKHEIISGSAIIDDNGTGYYSTKYGHGDALHVGDLDPETPGLEVFNIQEPVADQGMYMYNALSKKLLWAKPSLQDGSQDEGPGRGVCADITAAYKGAESWVSGGGIGGTYDCKGNQISTSVPASCNFLVWWDGDPLRELLNNTMIDKYGTGRVLTAYNLAPIASNNGTKSTPALSGDLIGDWREEVLWRAADNTALYLFTTINTSNLKFRTLMHDPQYRVAVAWQNTGYNQPPHPSFFLGDGVTTLAKPNITIIGSSNCAAAVTPSTPAAVCNPNTVVLSASVGNSYQWMKDGANISGATTQSYTVSASGSYTVKITDVNSCVATSAAVVVAINTSTSWYADTDGDGKGDPNVKQTACLQPNGYVADNTDLCPNDQNKTSPGVCGCGKVEESCMDCSNTVNGTAVIDNCDRCVGGSTGRLACNSFAEIETEACGFDGILETTNLGFKGEGYVNVANSVGSKLTLSVNSGTAGAKILSFRYANGSTNDRPATVRVNGVVLANALSFPSTAAFTTYQTVDLNVTLLSGNNTIELLATTAEGLANLDQIGYVTTGLSKGNCVITSIEADNLGQSISIFPNPSATSFHVTTMSPSDIEVYSMDGVLQYHKNSTLASEFGQDLQVGIYMMKIHNRFFKIVKE